jgi:molybdopterin-binding protein
VKLSTRNQIRGEVAEVKLGGIMAEVTVDIGGQTIVAAITRESAESLELAAGDQVTVLVKATEVMLGK